MSVDHIKSVISRDNEAFETPCYVYYPERISENYQRLKAALGTSLIISIKANHSIDLLSLISNEKDGYEATSEHELNMMALMKGRLCFLNNPSFNGELVRKAVSAKVQIIVDHPHQIRLLEPHISKIRPVMLRLNTGLLKQYLPEHPGMRKDHFGMDMDNLGIAIDKLNALGIPVEGIHLFKGSYSFNSTAIPTVEAIQALLPIIEERLGYPLKKVNLGGGLSAYWDQEGFDFAEYRARLAPLQERYEVLHESGRAVFAASGYFLTKVVSQKTINGHHYAICDGGLAQSFLLAQTENTFRKVKQPEMWWAQENTRETANSTVEFAGGSCNKDDIIGKLPAGSRMPETGDIAIFSECGAYNATYSPVNFLGLPKAKEYLLLDSSQE